MRKATSELQGDLFPLDAARAKATRERSRAPPWCVDCAVDTLAAGEWYMVHDYVWEQAVISPGQPFFYLCIGCLEKRLGRTLMASDFTDVPTNEIHGGKSPRLRDRMQTRAFVFAAATEVIR
jgi:hypothetical protein